MDYPKLRTEVEGDPVPLGYAGKTDQQIADLLNSLTTNRKLARTHVETTDILGAITGVPASWPAIASKEESMLRAILAMPFVDASNQNIVNIFLAIFPAGATRTALGALANRTVSRAEELSLGERVTGLDVARAKAGNW